MTLTTHAIVGAAAASLLPGHPVIAFAVGFASHFAVDAIPHLDYPIHSGSINPHASNRGDTMRLDRAMVLDAFTIGSDGLAGLGLGMLLFITTGNTLTIFFGICGGVLPDFLQFVYARFPHEPLSSLQHFHESIHSKHRLKGQIVLGVTSQLAFIVFVVLVTRLLSG